MTVEAPAPDRTGAWQEEPGFGVYVHIPFCAHRCHYCDFNTYTGQEDLHESYVEAVVRDVVRWAGPPGPATSVFFGGGTPTLLAPALLGRILRAVEQRFGIAAGAETTVEANPETVDERSLHALLVCGFNRLSIGVQSVVPRVLQGLGRRHSADRALETISAARRAGFGNVNADLIYGSQWEAEDDWARTLEATIDAGPDHVSAYALTIEEGTPLATLVATGRVADVDPDVQGERFEVAQRMLAEAGYVRYEISNWARPGLASRHNLLYWSAGDYGGFGAGAHSHVGGRRWWAVRLPRAFVSAVNRGAGVEAGAETLSSDQRAGEALMLGLRLASGIDVAGFARRFGRGALEARRGELLALEEAGLVEQRDGRLALTPHATLVANEALCRLL